MKIATRVGPPSNTGRGMPWLVLTAASCCALAVLVLGAPGEGSSSLDLLGATGMPHAVAFNVIALLVPGVLIGVVGVAVYLAAHSAISRIGALILVFSALAFAGQGVFPLDPMQAGGRMNRLHALFWSLWWMTIAAGAVLSLRHFQRLHGRRLVAMGGMALAFLVPVSALFLPAIVGSGIAQRVAYAAWFAWWGLAARALSRNAASVPGSSAPGRR